MPDLGLKDLFESLVTHSKNVAVTKQQLMEHVIDDAPDAETGYLVQPGGAMTSFTRKKYLPQSSLTVYTMEGFIQSLQYVFDRGLHDPEETMIYRVENAADAQLFRLQLQANTAFRTLDPSMLIQFYLRPVSPLARLLSVSGRWQEPRTLMLLMDDVKASLDKAGQSLPALLSSINVSIQKCKQLDQNTVSIQSDLNSIRVSVTLGDGASSDRLPSSFLYEGPAFLGSDVEVKLLFRVKMDVVEGKALFWIDPVLLDSVYGQACGDAKREFELKWAEGTKALPVDSQFICPALVL